MCKIGDIILINEYKDGNKTLRKHSFIVINDSNGTIGGLSYDIICNVLSSIKNDAQKQHKMSYPGNFPISNDDTVTNPDNGKDGYLKIDQLYYFNKDKIEYEIIGYIKSDILNLIFEFIEDSEFPLFDIIDNL